MKKGQKKIDLLKYFSPIIIIISSFFLYFNFQFLIQNPLIFVLIPIWTISLSFAFSKKRKIRKERIFTWLILITFLVIYFNFYASPFIIFAATPTPSPPSVSHSPEPQKGGSAITFSSNAAPGAAGELVKLLICKNNTDGCVLNSQWGYRKPITINNTQNTNALTDYQVLVTNPIYNETGLVGSWHFNEGSGTTAFDSSGNNNHGTLYSGTTVCSNPPTAGCPQWVDGKFGKALSFDGVDDYVRIPVSSGSSLDFAGKNKITVVAWVKALSSVTANADTFIGQDTSFFMRWRQGGGNNWGVGIYNGAWRELSVPGALNTWTHLALVYDGSILKLYKDGVLAASLATSGNLVANVKEINIGRFPTATTQRFNGIIDEVRIYNRALSDAEIQALYQAKARLDYGDIRFTDSDGSTLLNYWQEADGIFWVKVPSIQASSTKTIYVYYGNPSATSLSNGDATFDFFDDFLGTSLDINKWDYAGSVTISNGVARINPSVTTSGIRTKNVLGANQSLMFEIRRNRLSTQVAPISVKKSTANTMGGPLNSNEAVWTMSGDTHNTLWFPGVLAYDGVSVTGWFNHRFIWSNTTVYGFSGNGGDISTAFISSLTQRFSLSASSANYAYYSGRWIIESTITVATQFVNGLKIEISAGGPNPNAITDVDFVIVRKYTSPEPTTSVGTEEVPPTSNFIYTQSSAVSSNPSATYTCPSCQYSNNTYYGVAYSVNESVWTAFTEAKSFVCKMEVSQAGSCRCSSNNQCYNPCNVNWGTYYDGYCYNNKCYDAIPGSAFGLAQSCLAGTILSHETSSQRYANVNGRLYYCKGSDNSVSPYPFVFSLSPGSLAGNCKCLSDGNWVCPPGIIPIRGGRIKII
jgi:hypothetical protein